MAGRKERFSYCSVGCVAKRPALKLGTSESYGPAFQGHPGCCLEQAELGSTLDVSGAVAAETMRGQQRLHASCNSVGLAGNGHCRGHPLRHLHPAQHPSAHGLNSPDSTSFQMQAQRGLVGIFSTSAAKLGPLRYASRSWRASGTTRVRIWLTVSRVSFRMPLVQETIICMRPQPLQISSH